MTKPFWFPATLALALFILPSLAVADIVLNVDLSVENQVTISATDAVSASTVSGPDMIGFYFEAFYNGDPGETNLIWEHVDGGNLTSFLNTSDGSPRLFNSNMSPIGVGSLGLNIWDYTDNDPTSEFEAGIQAFSGSSTWLLTSFSYADMLAGNTSGNVWAFADTDNDIPSGGGTASLIGEYVVKRPGGAIPEPSSFLAVMLTTISITMRRSKSKFHTDQLRRYASFRAAFFLSALVRRLVRPRVQTCFHTIQRTSY